jgi:flagellar motor protein MotB
MKSGAVPSWAMSFADLCMLLLGFFIILHVQSSKQTQVVQGIKQAFGGRPVPAAESHDINPARLFEPGEALLRPEAQAELMAIGSHALRTGKHVRIESIGADRATRRFDGWELAAARAAAIARAVQTSGLPEKAIALSIPEMDGASASMGQRIAIEVIAPE